MSEFNFSFSLCLHLPIVHIIEIKTMYFLLVSNLVSIGCDFNVCCWNESIVELPPKRSHFFFYQRASNGSSVFILSFRSCNSFFIKSLWKQSSMSETGIQRKKKFLLRDLKHSILNIFTLLVTCHEFDIWRIFCNELTLICTSVIDGTKEMRAIEWKAVMTKSTMWMFPESKKKKNDLYC